MPQAGKAGKQTHTPPFRPPTPNPPSAVRTHALRVRRKGDYPLASQMCTPLAASALPLVEPRINQSSSSATPRQKVRLVVISGKDSRRLKRICAPKMDLVPVPAAGRTGYGVGAAESGDGAQDQAAGHAPVRSALTLPWSRIRRT